VATALYRRYRPETFADVIGQDHVTVPLMRALRHGRVGHAYLFSGPRGCGKTTSARILARCLNCAQGPTDAPCGECDSCRDLARGGPGSLDVVEIDAASHGGVDDARELRERATFAPARDRFKVFIIDEAHMVTSAGFNALLKLVEEPPEHVKFVFATTEPDKVIGTIRSRTHHYPFRLIPPQVLTPYLEQICAAEDVPVGDGVLPLVVRAGGGSARDTLSVLDQLMAGAGDDGIDHATAIALLGFTDTALLDTVIEAIARRDAAGMYGAVEQVIASGQEPRRFVEDLLERVRDLIVLSAVPERGEDLLPQHPADELARMRDQIEGFEAADLSRCGDLVHETLSTMSGATSPRVHLELLAARLVLRDERARTMPIAAPEAPSRGQGAPAGRPGPGGPASGRDRARQIAQEQAEAARRTRESERADDARSGAPAPTDPGGRPQVAQRSEAAGAAPAPSGRPESAERRNGASGPRVSAQDVSRSPDAGPEQTAGRQDAPSPGSSTDDDWGPVAPIGGAASQGVAGDQDAAAPRGDGRAQGSASAPQDGGEQPVDRAAPLHGGVLPHPEEHGEDASGGAAARGGEGGLDVDEVRGHWSAILDELQQIRRPTWALVSQNAHVHAAQGSTLVLGFGTDGLLAAFHRGTGAGNVADAVRRVMRREVMVEAVVGENPEAGSGAGGPDGRGGGGRQGGGPGSRDGRAPQGGGHDGPRGGGPGAPRGEAPARPASGEPGGSSRGQQPRDGAPGMGPREGRRPSGAIDERRAMGASDRGAAAGPGFPTDDDLPPEPDDPYPPDPYEDHRADPGTSEPEGWSPTSTAREASSAPGDWSSTAAAGDATAAPSAEAPSQVASAPETPAGSGERAELRRRAQNADGRDPSTAEAEPHGQVSAARQGLGAPASANPPDLTPIVVPDDSRDVLPDDTPRTHGQEALRRALETGRPVRTQPRTDSATPQSATGAPSSGPAAAPSTPEDEDPGSVTAPSRPHVSRSESSGPAHSGLAASGPAPSGPTPTGGAPSGRAPVDARSHPSAGPSNTAVRTAPGGPGRSDDGVRPARRSGAALVREAALASRAVGPTDRSGSRAARPADVEPAPEDPTGGASRDDEDAQYTSRRPQEIVEQMLGGTVLEIIDESR